MLLSRNDVFSGSISFWPSLETNLASSALRVLTTVEAKFLAQDWPVHT